MTCASGYRSIGNRSFEIVDCIESNPVFEDLMCEEIIYESDWCSAGVWDSDEDADWTSETSWIYDTIPTESVYQYIYIYFYLKT